MIEVILKQEIRHLGSKGELVRVAAGYARNYLIPKQLAMPATAANKEQVTQMQAAAEREAATLRGDSEKLAALLREVRITIVARAGEADQLFGSVTSRDIVSELEKLGYTVDRHKIVIRKPIRSLGDHEVLVHLHRDVEVDLKVKVLAEGREEEVDAEEEEEVRADGGTEEAAEIPTAEDSGTSEEDKPGKEE